MLGPSTADDLPTTASEVRYLPPRGLSSASLLFSSCFFSSCVWKSIDRVEMFIHDTDLLDLLWYLDRGVLGTSLGPRGMTFV